MPPKGTGTSSGSCRGTGRPATTASSWSTGAGPSFNRRRGGAPSRGPPTTARQHHGRGGRQGGHTRARLSGRRGGLQRGVALRERDRRARERLERLGRGDHDGEGCVGRVGAWATASCWEGGATSPPRALSSPHPAGAQPPPSHPSRPLSSHPCSQGVAGGVRAGRLEAGPPPIHAVRGVEAGGGRWTMSIPRCTLRWVVEGGGRGNGGAGGGGERGAVGGVARGGGRSDIDHPPYPCSGGVEGVGR